MLTNVKGKQMPPCLSIGIPSNPCFSAPLAWPRAGGLTEPRCQADASAVDMEGEGLGLQGKNLVFSL